MAMNQFADPNDLAGLSRGGNILEQLGYDPDEVRANPAMRDEVMQKIAGPYSPEPKQMAQNSQPPMPGSRQVDQSYLRRRAPTPQAAPASTPPQPIPDSLPKVSDAPTSANVSPSGTPDPAVANSRKAVDNLLSPQPDVPDTSLQDAMISATSIPNNPHSALYREGTAGKIGRGFKAFGRGLMQGGVLGGAVGAADPSAVGATPYDAPDSGYAIDEATRVAKQKRAQTEKQNVLDRFKLMTDQRKQGDTAAKDAGEISNSAAKLPNETTTANAAKTTADATSSRAETLSWPKNEDEAISAAEREKDPIRKAAYDAMAARMHANKMQEKPQRAPGEHPSAELQRYEDAVAARRRENGGKPLTSKDIADITSMLKTGDPNIDPEVGSIIAQAMDNKQKFADSVDRQDDGSYVDRTTGKLYTAQQFQDQINKLGKSDPNTRLAKKGVQIGDNGNLTSTRKSFDAPESQPASAPTNTTPKLRADGAFEGMDAPRAGHVAMLDATGNPRYVPQKDVAAALKAGYKRARSK